MTIATIIVLLCFTGMILEIKNSGSLFYSLPETAAAGESNISHIVMPDPNIPAVERVMAVLRDGEWHSTRQISMLTGLKQTTAQARVRDLRKEKFGSHQIDSRVGKSGIADYRLREDRLEAAE